MEARRGETPWAARCAARQRPPALPGDARTHRTLYDGDMVNEDQTTDDPLERMLRRSDELHEKLLALLDDAEFWNTGPRSGR